MSDFKVSKADIVRNKYVRVYINGVLYGYTPKDKRYSLYGIRDAFNDMREHGLGNAMRRLKQIATPYMRKNRRVKEVDEFGRIISFHH